MAQFYASIQGNRSEATRMGNKNSGITGHIRGWNVGGQVIMEHVNEQDICFIYATGGSNSGKRILVARIIDGVIFLNKEANEVKVSA